LRETAKEFLRGHVSLNNLESKLNYYRGVAMDYRVNGAVFHSNWGCKNLTLNRLEVGAYLEKELHIPVLTFEASMADPRGFDEGALRARLASLPRILDKERPAAEPVLPGAKVQSPGKGYDLLGHVSPYPPTRG
jgi:benzoyl-CoA reductase/2-hydroxyglutaryl-CoA dehydratase subunit BcrC/BadD/HgdB